ncbi:hypothetical protein Clacol_005124 [Clathrus columnatus]|uniref:Transposase n=1 Tax=Clathrus columnatus TaxID=1419009 RepID=A0AAV5AEG7_9AGAM|nr:hypothetical protein Clacol_005124 [Clathrus columnatus]
MSAQDPDVINDSDNMTHSLDRRRSHFYINRPMAQLPLQLAIALFWFGHFGNAASVDAVAQWAGVSPGCVVAATRHVMVAFLQHHDHVITWPTAQEKEESKNAVAEISCDAWRDGYCFVDGTLIPLAEKPGFHGE